MATAESVKAKIQGLIDTANNTTGNADKDLTAAVGALVAGYGAGGGSEDYYNTLWDIFQQNGERANYQYAFAGHGWNDETFKPKYPIKATSGSGMFYLSQITELPAGAVDWSYYNKSAYGSDMFANCTKLKIVHDAINIANIGRFNNMFSSCAALETVSFEGSNTGANWSNTFLGCSNLKNVRFNGIIVGVTNAIPPSFKDSPLLTNESVESIINALGDLTGMTTKNIVFHADVKARMTQEQIATITNKNWTLA